MFGEPTLSSARELTSEYRRLFAQLREGEISTDAAETRRAPLDATIKVLCEIHRCISDLQDWQYELTDLIAKRRSKEVREFIFQQSLPNKEKQQ
jgi:hypothetical protein